MKSPEDMQQLEELFHAAAQLGPQARAEFMARARISHPELAGAVESLIAAHEQPDSLIDAPAFAAAAEMIVESQPALVPGQLVGHYQVIEALGKGGMGEVYLASDTKLDRKVALKLLPDEFTNHKERLRRFVREAKAASSLNHPNIITIHEIGEADGVHFIATEFIDGQTLRQQMARAQMKLTEIIEISIQAASALHAAHAAGVVHRDIKPDNIMLRPDGVVKILDFGLAKLTEKSPGSRLTATDSEPVESEMATKVRAETVPGTVLGTIKYMSPEQARGQVLDQRTDIFSLGVVLYEMAAGRIPFTGATSMDTLVAILEKEPAPLDESAADIPVEFQIIVSKALRKDREERYQTSKDLLIDLKSFKEELAFAQKLERSRPPRTRVGPPHTTAADESATIIQSPAKRTAAAAISSPAAGKEAMPGRGAATVALAVVVLAGLLIGGAQWWRRRGSGPVPAQSSTPAVIQRSVSYWITVQKYRNGKPYQDPFRLRDDINFEKDYQLRLSVNSSQSGHLYLLNEGPIGVDQSPSFNVMFPSTTTNHGSALLAQNQQIQIPDQWFKFDEQQGTEKIWLVWAAQEIPELEAVAGFANPKDRGVISSPGLTAAVNQFLKAHSSTTTAVTRDEDKKETVVKANGEILVHLIKLEHH
jgi:serine/threonine protein kinase